jgi:ethanolamine ammonia-lyase small subunit
LQKFKTAHYDVVICLSNGLSSTAISQHGLGLLEAIITRFQAMNLTLGPIFLAANARVALSDAIAEHLSSAIAIMMIGERPGLSADDSLGLYLTYQPGQDNTDANRNCISNIRPPEGLSYDMAAQKLAYLTQNAYRLGYSGVMLKDDMQQTENLPDAIVINSLAEDDRRSD